MRLLGTKIPMILIEWMSVYFNIGVILHQYYMDYFISTRKLMRRSWNYKTAREAPCPLSHISLISIISHSVSLILLPQRSIRYEHGRYKPPSLSPRIVISHPHHCRGTDPRAAISP